MTAINSAQEGPFWCSWSSNWDGNVEDADTAPSNSIFQAGGGFDFSDGHIPEQLQDPQTGGLINAGRAGSTGCLLMDGERGR